MKSYLALLACSLVFLGPARAAEWQADSAALAAIHSVRAQSGLHSTLPEASLDEHLAKLLDWVERSYAQTGALMLLPDAPDARNGAGATSKRLQVLQQTFWLQDNALYGAGALREYAPGIGAKLEASWRAKWNEKYAKFCPDTESSYVIGNVPQYDLAAAPTDARCRLPKPGAWQYLRMYQYPSPQDAGFDALPLPIIGTDYPVDSGGQSKLVRIREDAVRDLLKYGCLRQVMTGDDGTAGKMLDLALAQWDGKGFRTRKGEEMPGMYWTRDLAFALICANALSQGGKDGWASRPDKAVIESQLWAAQSTAGGIWTNYCDGSECTSGRIPATAKQTNEIAPLVLLAYGANIWRHRP